MRKVKTIELLALSNFIASFGGGGLLAKGLSSLGNIPGFHADAIFAYLLGTALSLFFILGARSWIHRAGAYLSLVGAALSFFVAMLLIPYGNDNLILAWLMFVLLAVVFSMIFVPRTFRSDLAAQQSYHLPWVEFAYGAGYLVSLLVWRQFPNASLSTSFLVAGAAFLICSLLDIATSRATALKPETSSTQKSSAALPPADSSPTFGPIVMVSLITIAVQVAIQRLCAVTSDSLPLIAFEIGIIAAPLIAIALKMESMLIPPRSALGIQLKGKAVGLPSVNSLCLILLISMIFTMGAARMYGSAGGMIFVGFVICSTLYELVAILLLEGIAKLSRQRGKVALAFGIMGISATAVYAFFLFLEVRIEGILLTVILCTVASLLLNTNSKTKI